MPDWLQPVDHSHGPLSRPGGHSKASVRSAAPPTFDWEFCAAVARPRTALQDAQEMVGPSVIGDELSGSRAASHIAGYEHLVEFRSLLAPVAESKWVTLNVWLRRVRCPISRHVGLTPKAVRRGALSSSTVLIVRLTSDADVEVQAVGSTVTGITVEAGEGAAVRPEVPTTLEAGDSRIVASFSRSLPVLDRRTVTVWWDGAAGRQTETVEWPPHPN